MKTHVRYFPFSPGIGWKIKNGKYVVPEINLDVWNKIISGKDITVVCYGGLIESYISLCYLEILNYIVPNNTFYWCGNNKFDSLVRLNGLARIGNFPKNMLWRYPVPIFMDADKNVYFNCLNNVLKVQPYYGGTGYKDKSPLVKQLLRNSTLPWDKQYLPKMRRSSFPSKEFLQWSKLVRFDLNKPFICIFQDLDWSQHKRTSFKWNETQIKALSSMLKQRGISTVVFTKVSGKFYGSSVYCMQPLMESILGIIPRAKAVLAEEVDFLLLSAMISNAKLITTCANKCLSPIYNGKFLGLNKNGSSKILCLLNTCGIRDGKAVAGVFS